MKVTYAYQGQASCQSKKPRRGKQDSRQQIRILDNALTFVRRLEASIVPQFSQANFLHVLEENQWPHL